MLPARQWEAYMLELENVSQVVDGETLIDDISLQLTAERINLLLGPTLSGKTSLMRLMAGLERPTSGQLRFGGKTIDHVPVRQRNVAMVYQQFINYPSLTAYENIASPLRLQKLSGQEIDNRVREAAEQLQLSALLERRPAELSGGQQQRLALARALVKRAELVLLDEPLANLDYKLREELRRELPALFAEQGAVLVYATAEPNEALLLGGNTAVLHEGRLVQFGDTLELFHTPRELLTAKAFSDPPLNVAEAGKTGDRLKLAGVDVPLPATARQLPDALYRVAVRPWHLALQPGSDDWVRLEAKVTINEISGSESFLHFELAGQDWVALLHGVQQAEPAQQLPVYLDPSRLYLFDAQGGLAHAPGERH
jgi:glycerol transport system ATP-binding protein